MSVSLVLVFYAISVADAYVDPDRGPFCASGGRDGRTLCCAGRHDNCSLPRGYGAMETVCYCDAFCVRTHPRPHEPDCCPDYRPACLGEPLPTPTPPMRQCYFKERFWTAGVKFMENCNTCECMDMGNRMEIMCTQNQCMVEEMNIRNINRQRRGWTAGNVTTFWGRQLEEGYNGMLGTNYSPRKVRTMHPIRSVVSKSHLPTWHDWRSKRGFVTPIVDQQFCNASWSYAIVSTFSDRLAKWSNGKDLGPLSYQQHRNCVRGQRRAHPCNSGYLTRSWKYMMNTGLVKESCYPSSSNSRCEVTERRLSTKVMMSCPAGGVGKLYKASALSRLEGESAIMKEVLDAGPVIATMRVFPEFFMYQEGIYDCPNRNPKSGRLHTVKIVGWGEEHVNAGSTPVPYWIVANSWGTGWGEDGFFRIQRGSNACDIEEFVLSFYTNSRRAKRSQRTKNPFLPA